MLEVDTEAIRIGLAKKNITRKELAHRAGITEMTLRRILTGGDCMVTTLASIAHALDLNSNEILIVNGNGKGKSNRSPVDDDQPDHLPWTF